MKIEEFLQKTIILFEKMRRCKNAKVRRPAKTLTHKTKFSEENFIIMNKYLGYFFSFFSIITFSQERVIDTVIIF